MKTVAKYAGTLVALVALGFLLLFLAGLFPQQAVRQNVRESAAQYEAEGLRPQPLYTGDLTYQLDNFSDALILTHALYMDTRSDPKSMVVNPPCDEFRKSDGAQGLLTITETETPPVADKFYAHYFQGFRAVVRPLLTVLNYMQIRQMLMWAVLLLFLLAALMLARRVGTWMAVLFATCFLAMNPVIIVNSMQFSCCFLLAFSGMLLTQRVKDTGFFNAPMLFFLLGAATQYFDFYTTPALTFCLPMIALLSCTAYGGTGRGVRARLALAGQCFAAWMAAYLGVWLVQLLVTRLVMGTATAAMDRVQHWMELRLSTIVNALACCLRNVRTPETVVLIGALGVAFVVRFVRNPSRWQGLSAGLPYLVVGALPIVWFIVAAGPTGFHSYFQYRAIMGTLLGGCMFLLSGMGMLKGDSAALGRETAH